MSSLTVDLASGFAALGVDKRLADTPPTAHTRGLFFRLAEQAVEERSRDLVSVWRAASGARSCWAFKLYPRDHPHRRPLQCCRRQPGFSAQMGRPRPVFLPSRRGFMGYLTGGELMQAADLARTKPPHDAITAIADVPTGTNSASFHYEDEYTWLETAASVASRNTSPIWSHPTVSSSFPSAGRCLAE
jgi:hypothetical protein